MAVKASASITLSFMVDIKAVYRYYKLQSSTAAKPDVPTTNPPSGWTDSEPSYTSGSTNTLYFVDLTVFTDDSFLYSAVSMSSAYEAAKEAYNKATNAQNTANNAQSSIDNLEIGGRNYCRNSAFIDSNKLWSGETTFTVDDTKTLNGNPSAKVEVSGLTNNAWRGPSNYCLPTYKELTLKKGETWTASCWYYVEDASTFDANLTIEVKGVREDATSESGISSASATTSTIVEGEWTKLSTTFTPSVDFNTCVIRSYVVRNGTAWFTNFKLEKGKKATDWTPAPEDAQSKIDISVESVDVEYYLSESSTSLSGGSWSTTAPTWVNGKYMWSRTKTTLQNGTASYKPSENGVCIAGATGPTGATGATGTGISSMTEEYYISTSKTAQSGGSWSTTVPTWSAGKYIWTRIKIVYTNPSSTAYTTPLCDSSWEAINDVQIGGRNYIRYGKGDVKRGFFENFNTVENGYGEHTLTSKKTYPSVYLKDGFVLDCRDYPVGAKVTFSFDIMYTAWNFPEGTTRSEWWVGQRYTGGTTESNVGAWRAVTNQFKPPEVGINCELNEWVHVEKTMVIPEQAHESIGTTAAFQFYNSNADVEASVTFRIKNVKLEYGDKATDWTAAPEDMDDEIDSVREEINNERTRISDAIVDIDAIKGQVVMYARDDDGNESIMSQDGTSFTFGLTDIKTSIDDANSKIEKTNSSVNSTSQRLDVLADQLDKYSSYITFGETSDTQQPYIELGEADTDFKLVITNEAIQFKSGSNIPAEITNESLLITKAEITDDLSIGSFVWKARGNGNVGLMWKEKEE